MIRNPLLWGGVLAAVVIAGVFGLPRLHFSTQASSDKQVAAYQQALTVVMRNTFGVVCKDRDVRAGGMLFAAGTKANPVPIFPVVVICADNSSHIITGVKTK